MNDDLRDAARRLIPPVQVLRQRALALEVACDAQIQAMSTPYSTSARNMMHFLAVRRSEISPLRRELAVYGFHPFLGTEAGTMAALNLLLVTLHTLAGEELPTGALAASPTDARTGQELLRARTRQLLGESPRPQEARMVVTAPSDAATDPAVLRNLLMAGMNILRIDCAADGPAAWQAMIRHCRQAERESGKPCKILLELAGTRPRTGNVESAGRVAKFQPKRDLRGQVVQPARLRFVPAGQNGSAPAAGVIPLPKAFWERIRTKDEIKFKDTRGRNRTLSFLEQQGDAWLAEADDTCYLETGTVVRLVRRGQRIVRGEVGHLPDVLLPLSLQEGDALKLVRGGKPGRPARYDLQGNVVEPARIPCTQDAAMAGLRPGERVYLEEGRVGAVVMGHEADGVLLTVTQVPPGGARLRAGRLVHLPDSVLNLPALTPEDTETLRNFARQVEMVSLASMRTAEDVEQLQRALGRLQVDGIGLVIKVDTRQAFENLPRLLLAGLQRHPVGVLLGRSDLAVEYGLEHLPEIQEEVRALCTAAHLPLIWEALVNENPAKQWQPGRAELMDVRLAGHAGAVLVTPVASAVAAVRHFDAILAPAPATASQPAAELVPPVALPVAP